MDKHMYIKLASSLIFILICDVEAQVNSPCTCQLKP